MALADKSAGGSGDQKCSCVKCECETVEDCLDPRLGCTCNGKCCNAHGPDQEPEYVFDVHENDRELEPVPG